MFGRMVKQAAAALLVMAAGLGAANAQNYDGSGLVKFGVFGQGTFLDVDMTQPVAASASPSGFSGGVSAGYDLTIHRYYLLGIEVDGSFGDARDKAALTDFGFDYLMTVLGRFGVYARPDWLIYGTAGVGFLGIEATLPVLGGKASETLTGFVGGIGTEVDVFNHFILFGEYLYGTFDDRSFSIADIRHTAGIDAHLFRLGIKFKVGHDYAHDYDHPDHYKRRHDSLK